MLKFDGGANVDVGAKGLFTLHVYINITVKLTKTQRMGSDLISAFLFAITIDAMLNFDGDVDVNADVKCEQSISVDRSLRSFHTERFRHRHRNVDGRYL